MRLPVDNVVEKAAALRKTGVTALLGGILLIAWPMEREAPRRIERLRWLSGCWEQRDARSTVEEFWTSPNGGILFGIGRTIVRRDQSDSTVSYELTRVFERGGRLVYAAAPSGQPTAEFTEQELTDTTVVFANPTHDFPQFVRYRRRGTSELHARVDGKMNGKEQGFGLQYRRISCPG
jgi:Domain of unknown function (DUF6265)